MTTHANFTACQVVSWRVFPKDNYVQLCGNY